VCGMCKSMVKEGLLLVHGLVLLQLQFSELLDDLGIGLAVDIALLPEDLHHFP
jgi:hypothetical protein